MTRPEGSHTCRGGIKRPVWRPWTWPTPHLDRVAGGIRARVLAESQAFEGIGAREAANFAGQVVWEGAGRPNYAFGRRSTTKVNGTDAIKSGYSHGASAASTRAYSSAPANSDTTFGGSRGVQ